MSPKGQIYPSLQEIPSMFEAEGYCKGNARSLISSIQAPIHILPHSHEMPVWSRFVQCSPAHKENPLGHLHPSQGCSWGTTGCPSENKQYLQSRALEQPRNMGWQKGHCSILCMFAKLTFTRDVRNTRNYWKTFFHNGIFLSIFKAISLKFTLSGTTSKPNNAVPFIHVPSPAVTVCSCRCKGWHADVLGSLCDPLPPAKLSHNPDEGFVCPPNSPVQQCPNQAPARTL